MLVCKKLRGFFHVRTANATVSILPDVHGTREGGWTKDFDVTCTVNRAIRFLRLVPNLHRLRNKKKAIIQRKDLLQTSQAPGTISISERLALAETLPLRVKERKRLWSSGSGSS